MRTGRRFGRAPRQCEIRRSRTSVLAVCRCEPGRRLAEAASERPLTLRVQRGDDGDGDGDREYAAAAENAHELVAREDGTH